MGEVRILFAGSPEAALPALEVVADVADSLAVMSQPDKPVGRKKVLTATPVSSWALERGIALHRPVDHDGIAQTVSDYAPELAITVAYGRILRPNVLDMPPAGWWNLHFSLLPRWRGAAPVQNALLAGDTETGVSVFRLDEGVDTGPLLGQRSHPVRRGMNAGELLTELSHTGAELLRDTLASFHQGQHSFAGQSGEATHAPKLDRQVGRILPNDSLEMALRRFGATTPEPGCFVSLAQGQQTLRILAATALPDPTSPGDGRIMPIASGVGISLAGGFLLLESVVPAGKKAMASADWWRGVHGEHTIDA